MNDALDERIQTLETRIAFQEDWLQKLDDAISSQQRQLLDIQQHLKLLLDQLRSLEQSLPEGPEPPPPHY